jgi:hypothetical protein
MSPKTKRVTKRAGAKSKSTSVSSKLNQYQRTKANKDADPLGIGWRPGRPSKYDPKYCDEIIIHCRKGETFESFASKLNVHTDTIQEWAREHKEFSLARRRAKLEAEQYMIRLGQKCMLGKKISPNTEGKPRYLNQSMWQFFMKCRFGWREDETSNDQDDNDLEFEFEDN